MSGLKARLARLRQTAAASGSGSGSQVRAVQHEAEHALRQEATLLQGQATGGDEREESGTGGTGLTALDAGFVRLGVREEVNEAGSFLLRRLVYPATHRHGLYRLGELPGCAQHLRPLADRQDDVASHLDAEKLLFLDTETTGLGVGTGNVPFMIGIGYWSKEAFVVEQSFIRHPGEERAMLMWLSGIFQRMTHLVTYNGRSFDWPLLESRFVLNGWRRTGPGPGHFDLLHPARALWKHSLPTCRLGTVEEERLDITREDDLPGALAPEIYMRYLQDGDAAQMKGVYEHNAQDLLTLATLAIHLGYLLGGQLGRAVPEPIEAEEKFRTGVWLEKHGKFDEAKRLFDKLHTQITAEGTGENVELMLALAARYKRQRHWPQALALWKQAAAMMESATLPRLDAHVELAVYYEHRAKDCRTALHYAMRALACTQRRISAVRFASAAAREQKSLLEHRIARLERKLGKLPDVWRTREQRI